MRPHIPIEGELVIGVDHGAEGEARQTFFVVAYRDGHLLFDEDPRLASPPAPELLPMTPLRLDIGGYARPAPVVTPEGRLVEGPLTDPAASFRGRKPGHRGTPLRRVRAYAPYARGGEATQRRTLAAALLRHERIRRRRLAEGAAGGWDSSPRLAA